MPRMLPEHQPAAPPTYQPPTVPASSADSVDRILAYTDTAIASIVRRTEHQVREIAVATDARGRSEAIERHAQLAQLRRELTDRASALAIPYEAILNQLEAAEAALALWAGTGAGAEHGADAFDPRVDAIKMTLRERQRISIAYEEPAPAPVYAMPAPAPIPFREEPAPRRWWQRRHREAA
jgi:hypothetical protein